MSATRASVLWPAQWRARPASTRACPATARPARGAAQVRPRRARRRQGSNVSQRVLHSGWRCRRWPGRGAASVRRSSAHHSASHRSTPPPPIPHPPSWADTPPFVSACVRACVRASTCRPAGSRLQAGWPAHQAERHCQGAPSELGRGTQHGACRGGGEHAAWGLPGWGGSTQHGACGCAHPAFPPDSPTCVQPRGLGGSSRCTCLLSQSNAEVCCLSSISFTSSIPNHCQVEHELLHLLVLLDVRRSTAASAKPAQPATPSLADETPVLRCSVADADAVASPWWGGRGGEGGGGGTPTATLRRGSWAAAWHARLSLCVRGPCVVSFQPHLCPPTHPPTHRRLNRERKAEAWRKAVTAALRPLHKELVALEESGALEGYRASRLEQLQSDAAMLICNLTVGGAGGGGSREGEGGEGGWTGRGGPPPPPPPRPRAPPCSREAGVAGRRSCPCHAACPCSCCSHPATHPPARTCARHSAAGRGRGGRVAGGGGGPVPRRRRAQPLVPPQLHQRAHW